MYNFIDVNEASESVLPSEALKLNGEYIENLISGYRTLAVSGREALSPEINTIETGIRDGSFLQNKRYPARTIIVKYQLIAKTNEAFRNAYNELGRILNVKNAEMIFDDEPDKYFVGTPSAIGEVDPGINNVTGEIEFICADPFKYSIIEYEAEKGLNDSGILIEYNGTYKGFPVLEADFYNESEVAEDGKTLVTLTGNGDCGYVAFFNENEKIIQLGDPNEADGSNAYASSQTLVNQTFLTNTAWGTQTQALWSANNGVVLPSDVVQTGNVGMKAASYAEDTVPKTTWGTLIREVKSTVSSPGFVYTVIASASGRTESSVKINASITTQLLSSDSYFGRGYGLIGSVYMGGAWHNVTIKSTSEYWKGRTGHVANLSFTVSGLIATTSSLTGIKFKVTRTDGNGTAGNLGETACSNLRVSQYVAGVPETYYLSAVSYGTSAGKWHGPSISRIMGADANGDVGAQDFTFTYKQKMSIGNGGNGQLGAFQVQLWAENGGIIAGVRIYKNTSGTAGRLVLYLNGSEAYTGTLDLSYNNKYFGAKESSVQTSTITKTGNKITFSIGGLKKTFTNDYLTDTKVLKITFTFEQYSTAAALTNNGLYWAKFVKNNCDTWNDIPNKFSANDIVEADCKDGKIYLNGIHSPEYGALGNDWEEFYLTPGLNQIGVSYSNWVSTECAPKFKVRYREVFL